MTRKFDGDRLLVATHNQGKLDEITELLKPLGFRSSVRPKWACPNR